MCLKPSGNNFYGRRIAGRLKAYLNVACKLLPSRETTTKKVDFNDKIQLEAVSLLLIMMQWVLDLLYKYEERIYLKQKIL
jgi:hypothetical protein